MSELELFDDPEPTNSSDDTPPAAAPGPGHGIMVVDDDPVTRLLLTDQFERSGRQVAEASSGEQCLNALDAEIGVLLLDVNMEGMDGIETCRRLRAQGNDRMQVIFISADGEIETRLRAYDAGGTDFIVKPIDPDELERKVAVAQRALAAFDDVAGQAATARQAAFAAMSSMSEMGTVLEFMRRSFACEDDAGLARCITDTLAQYGLNGLVAIGCGPTRHCFSAAGPCTPLEQSILENSREMQRIFQFSNRLVINYPEVTIVVSGLPVHDPDQVGRLRDHLAVLAEGASARACAFEMQRQRDQQGQTLVAAVTELRAVIASVSDCHARNRARAKAISAEFLARLEAAFIHLGLTELQESELIELAGTATRDIAALQEDMLEIEKRLFTALATLRG